LAVECDFYENGQIPDVLFLSKRKTDFSRRFPKSPSPVLYPFFVLSLDAGLRPSESRSLRWRDLILPWADGAISEGEIVVSRSKTEGGTGRVVPLTRRASGALTVWHARFPDAEPGTYVFPFHRVGLAGNSRKYLIWDVDRDRPMGQWSYKTAFESARQKCRITCRFYDASHTFVTRLAENPTVSVETIRQLAGRAGDRMLGRYAHIRVQARREAIATLERRQKSEKFLAIGRRRTQNWAQSPDIIKTSGRVVMKTLSLPENKRFIAGRGGRI
jgi:integrase